MQKIKSKDTVIVIAGADKGKVGKVLRVVKEGNLVTHVYVENANMRKKHVKPNPNINEPGGIIAKEGPIHISNVALYNSATGKADKVKIQLLEDGRKVRVFKSNNEVVEEAV